MINKLFKERGRDKRKMADDFLSSVDAHWLKHELVFQHQNKKFQFRANDNYRPKFGKVINSLFDIKKEELSVLSINDGNLTTIDNKDEIWNFDIFSLYKYDYIPGKGRCSKLESQIVMTLSYRNDNDNHARKDKSILQKNAMLIVHLNSLIGVVDKAIYIQATFCIPTVRFGRNGLKNSQPDCLSILIAYDYRSQEENTQEFWGVFNSAKEKIERGKFEELNGSERSIMDVLYHPLIAQEFYLGKSAMNENRYWDAIKYFSVAFKGLQQKYWDKETNFSDQESQTLVECSYLTGYCYYELGLFDKSYKYLEFSAHNSDNYKYLSEYINCLIALRDVRVSGIIQHYLDLLIDKKEGERTEEAYNFFMFILRRKAYCLIELEEYDAAEFILKRILEREPSNEFAKQEMEYIQQMRNGE